MHGSSTRKIEERMKSNIMITTKLYHSLTSIKPEYCEGKELKQYTICGNEPFSFQMAYKILTGEEKSLPFFVKLITDLPVNCYYTGYVPVIHADYSVLEPRQSIGMYPDVLIPKKVNTVKIKKEAETYYRYCEKDEKVVLAAYNDSWQALWFAVNEEGEELQAGTYSVRIELYDRSLAMVGQSELCLEVLDARLPQQSLIYTNWFHYDCLADYYHVEIFSDRYFEIMRDFVRKAVRNGMNMLLTPAFTPPLDTALGMERMTAQLVKIKLVDGKYEFDFGLLKRFVDICREEGIVYFEHSHLFTQWGAEHAPQIVAWVDGKEVRIFGWDTDALSQEYISFLRAYLTELKKFLQRENLEKNIFFHISDEPREEHFQNYQRAYEAIGDLLEGYMMGDALSDPRFYEEGYVKIPIACTRTAAEFVGKGDPIWCYYTGMEIDQGMSNRLIQMPRERNRMLGVQMYYHNMKGFLQWAYNFYYGELCSGQFDPWFNPCGGFPNAGTSYFVYPAHDGTACQSVRQKIFAEGLTDMRILTLLESLTDRQTCIELIEKYLGVPDFYTSPEDSETFMIFRQAVIEKIKSVKSARV